MSSRVVRAENLLWFAPILFGLLANYAAYSEKVLLFVDNQVYIFSFSSIIIICITIVTIPFIMHSVLRDLDLRNFFSSWAHIFFTCLLTTIILLIFTYSQPINLKWIYHAGELPAYRRWMYYNTMALGVLQLLVYLQAFYLVYGIGVLIKHRHNKKVEESAHYDYMVNQLDRA
ncbi:MAG: hypothetical protein C0446_13675 [Chitinophaga sp.]|nr:hypothetical protein [Chitinophaga sp.]PJE47557.1 MAG: hypothetical protein CUR34_03115 [Sediminibacterium sp.] [Sediminibacterium sp. FEMGT703S]